MTRSDQERVRAALDRREALGVTGETRRVVDGVADGFPGVTVEQFGGVWMVSVDGRASAQGWEQAVDLGWCEAVWLRRLERGEKAAPEWLAGRRDERWVVTEAQRRYEIQPAAGYNCGLFLDQRDNRQRVADRVKPGHRVLNLFSYTCSFSVAAALSGAVVTSVDLNAGYLDWGRRNLALNGLDPASHFWTRGDSFDWLAAFAKKGHRFDGVVLDPPTFSRGTKKKVFRVERDYAELVELAARVMAPGGWLLACANTHRQRAEEFAAWVELGLSRAGLTFSERKQRSMPVDFVGSSYLKALWLDGAQEGD